MTKHEENQILQNSIERVLNSAIRLIENADFDTEELQELRDVNLDDLQNLKQITVMIWNEKRDQIFRKRNNLATTEDEIIRHVAELPDRSSPEDWPEAMLVTENELRKIIQSVYAK